MNVLKAYADAGAMGQQHYGSLIAPARQGAAARQTPKRSGDFVSLSNEAMELLGSYGTGQISMAPQDATYDQHGQVTRQLDSLQADLRHLATQFMAQPDGGGMLGHIGAMQSRLATIRAQV